MSETPLEVVEEHDYLGVRLHHKLSWSPHVNHICNKANRMLGFLNRNLFHVPQNIREYTYKQLVLPSIDYCSAIWDPYTKNDISKLEMLQNRAARFVMNKPWYRKCHNVSITKILAELHWPTLQNRRKQARLILMFKIVNGFQLAVSLYLQHYHVHRVQYNGRPLAIFRPKSAVGRSSQLLVGHFYRSYFSF